MSKLLVVVDMQWDFVYGSLGTKEAQAIVPFVVEKIKNTDADCIVYTMDIHDDSYMTTKEGKYLPVPHCFAGSGGSQIIPEIKELWNDNKVNIVHKNTFGFYDWNGWLGNDDFDEIEFIGVCTDICVVSNALILKSLCPESTFIVDAACCAGSTPDNHNAALKVMKSCHMEIQNWQEEMKPAEPIRDTYVGYWITCPNCGYENNLAEAKFCANCSQKFDRSELDDEM